MNVNLDGEILDAVIKRACGYNARETVEEYTLVDGSLELTKKRVTVKDVPPDMTAVKLIIDGGGADDLTDDELEKQKLRLLCELAERERATENQGGKA